MDVRNITCQGRLSQKLRRRLGAIAAITLISNASYAGAAPINFAAFSDHVNGDGYVVGAEVTWTGNLVNGVAKTPNLCIPCVVGAIILFGLVVSLDPESSYLLTDFRVDGQSVFNQLVTEAAKPQNVDFTQRLPSFLGGATLIGSHLYGGQAYVSDLPVSDLPLAFGIINTDAGASYLTPIIFGDDVLRLREVSNFDWDLSSILGSNRSGTFETVGRALVTYAVPEPASLSLFGLGFGALLAINRRKKCGRE